jgi:hypothetical protein
MLKFVLPAIVTLLFAGCAHQAGQNSQGPWSTIDGADNIIVMQRELEKPSFALDKVMIVRMTMDGTRFEVASIAPTVIVAQPAAGNRTVMNFNDRQKLILFTRDGRNIKGYRMEIPVAELKEGKIFRFPVAQDPGEVVEKSFSVDKVIIQ